MKELICLGIETTAHTFGIGIVTSKGKVLANYKKAYTTEKGGIIPYHLFEHHTNVATEVLEDALKIAGVKIQDIGLISYSNAPGLGNALRVGAFVARYLAGKYKIPLVGVNHCIAHLEIGRLLTNAKDPVLLYASGANTQIIAYEGKKYRIFGETLDIGVGNFLDSFARHIGLGFPGGPKIEELARKYAENEKNKNINIDNYKEDKNNINHNVPDLIDLPYSVKGMDVAFGGLLTNLKQKFDSDKFSKEELCYSVQETVFAMLVEVSERAIAHTGKNELLLGGGVACNKRLQEMCRIMCEERGAKFFVPANDVLVDNGLMIAWNGILAFKNNGYKCIKIENADIKPYERTDEVVVKWR
ncbi:TPA: tRNA (adenosine(37)-N6)-threonylcarbamoyltransferase complex transferase subunit TsaD [Candidatus Woesearchaeota archaeon]|nr:tRNA (adenosine(37)-N6)-threonylcarbamoyltransferase complex transferase subunit TsaD [Candidatus Woesearchaeota archaeon]